MGSSNRTRVMATRRQFVKHTPIVVASVLALRPLQGKAQVVHPEPRPGIDGSEVMTREQLTGFSDEVKAVFDMVREIPQIADGIGCTCGCSAMPGYRSLLTCYYASGMARGCAICQGQGRLAYRRHQEGQTLEQIRRATDARFG